MTRVDAVLFDMGGTLWRAVKRDDASRAEIVKKIQDSIGSDASPEEFTRLLNTRMKAYRKWAKQNLVELNESDLWTRWLLPEYLAEKIAPLAVDLTLTWRDAIGPHRMIPEAPETLLGLFRRGYRLGLVSNTTSSVEVPRALEEKGLAGCFDTVILSCVVGKRKPGGDILLEAAQRMGVPPERCAYVGNRPDRDVTAARNAGFCKTVILRDPERPFKKPVTPETEPDHTIDNLEELLELFPARRGKDAPAAGPLYDISLSTMWGIKKFARLSDFLLAAPRLGLAGIELNHQVTPSMLEGLDLDGVSVSSIHEPCPAVISADTLKRQDILISSPDEARRQEGVKAIQRSLDLAKELRAPSIVIHAGMVQFDPSLEKKLVSLLDEGKAGKPEYEAVKQEMVTIRRERVAPCLEAVQKSLRELLAYAGNSGVRLGLENRYHYFDIPSPDEMELLLSLADASRLGFIYDTGHAQALDRLGFYPHEGWLKRFADRILGSHLHDIIGINDHLAPGLGELDFKMVASYLPDSAFRTLEVKPHNTNEQVKNGLSKLVETGCIHPL